MKGLRTTTLSGVLLSAFAALAAPQVMAGVTDKDIEADGKTTTSILSWGMGTEGQRYSPLDKINVKNVKNLVPAWSFSFGGEKQRGQESQPLIVNGKMFVTGSYSRLYALDAKTGKRCGSTNTACRTASCRAATW
jgi:alcohol dehydrogenase (cytochrome c)